MLSGPLGEKGLMLDRSFYTPSFWIIKSGTAWWKSGLRSYREVVSLVVNTARTLVFRTSVLTILPH